MGKRAVLVGCNYPGTDFELGGSVNDVKIVKEMLIETYGFKEETSDDFKKILTKFPLNEGATFTVIADASQSDGLLEGHEVINPPQPPRMLLRRIKEEAEEGGEDEAVVAKSAGEASVATEGAAVSKTNASSARAPAADETTEDKKAVVKPKDPAATPAKETATAAKEAAPAAAAAAAAAAKEPATAAVKQPAAPKESAPTASKKSATVVKEGPAAGHAKSSGAVPTKPAVSAKAAAAPSTKSAASANTKNATATPTRSLPTAPTKPAPAAAPMKADAAPPLTTVSKSLTVEVTEKPGTAAVPEPAANGSAEDSAAGARTKRGTEQEEGGKVVIEANESAETDKEAGNEATGNDTEGNEAEVVKVVGPQSRQIDLDTFLDALSQKGKKKAAKGNIRRSLHEQFGDSSSRTVKNYVQKLRRQKSSPIHRRGLSALMEMFACGAVEAQQGKGNQAAAKGPAIIDSDESRTIDLGAHEEIQHIQSCVLLTDVENEWRRNRCVPCMEGKLWGKFGLLRFGLCEYKN
ncbi:hypothetical protein CBR_g38516 [Chara braunii]|uniref:Uncharacterized protein n=1 Tax=Chara braunii TaxID=69332 RepID=A0A388JNY4_CHABU|nr:hypothetical protein CBR_g38516 [Chara braunii]|eukprot:GBG59491.1 hypothetical protein CBR_g38516 [Chara braunii]